MERSTSPPLPEQSTVMNAEFEAFFQSDVVPREFPEGIGELVNSIKDPEPSINAIDLNLLQNFSILKNSKFFVVAKSSTSIDSELDDEIAADTSTLKQSLQNQAGPTMREIEEHFAQQLTINDVLAVPPKTIAKQLALVNSQSFKRITRSALESLAWSGPDKWTKAASVADCFQRFNQITLWVSHEILETSDIKIRAQKIIHYIYIASNSIALNDFNGAKCILTGLEYSPVHRLEQTWALVGKQDMNMYNKLADLLTPSDNASVYRKRLKKATPPFLPFLGIHLGDLIYLSEAKKAELSKGDVEAARGRESQIAQMIDQLQNFQNTCSYDFEEIKPIQALLLQSKYITELQKFVEDQSYALSYAIEPKQSMKARGSNLPTQNVDLMSLPIDQLPKSLSEDGGLNDVSRPTHERAHSQSCASPTNQYPVRHPRSQTISGGSIYRGGSSDSDPSGSNSNTSKVANNPVKEKKSRFSFWGGNRKDSSKDSKTISLPTSPTSEGPEPELYSKTSPQNTVKPNTIGRFSKRNNEGHPSVIGMFNTTNTISSITSNKSPDVDHGGFFDNSITLKEGLLTVKVKSSLQKASKVWEVCWCRLFPDGYLMTLPKKPISLHEKMKQGQTTYRLTENSMVEVAADYTKRNFVFRLRPDTNNEVLFEASNEQDLYDWISFIQKCLKGSSRNASIK